MKVPLLYKGSSRTHLSQNNINGVLGKDVTIAEVVAKRADLGGEYESNNAAGLGCCV